MRVPRQSVIDLLNDKNCTHIGLREGKDVWVTSAPDNLIVRLPPTGAIPLALVEIICNKVYWQFGYQVTEFGSLIGSGKRYFIDEYKKPLPKTIIIWQSKPLSQ